MIGPLLTGALVWAVVAARDDALRTRAPRAAARGRLGADSAGTGWSLRSVALDVVAHPDSGRLILRGTLALVPPAGGSAALTLVLTPGMRFEGVDADGVAVQLSAAADTARLRLPRPLAASESLAVRFRARAQQPRVARSVAVGAEGAFASWYGNWYPWPAAARGTAPDMAARGTLEIAMPERWHSLASGRLVDSAAAGGWRRERWESTRELAWSVIAAEYHVRRTRVGTTDVGIYLMPRQAAKADAFAAAIPPMVGILERAYGPYPFDTFGLAAIPAGIAPPGIGGRSENGYFLAHEHALDADTVETWLFAHELAHMWWANTVLSDPPGDDMVDEGMAAHAAVVVLEAQQGRAAARRYLRDGTVPNSAREFFHLWRTGRDERLMNDFATLPSYSKGAWVYEMLRRRVGDAVFFGTLRQLVRERAGKSTTLADIRAAFVRVAPAGADLERFFADWLDRPGAPVLDVAWTPARRGGAPAARVRIVQRTAPYRLPLDVEVSSARGRRRTRVLLTDSVQTFLVDAAGAPRAEVAILRAGGVAWSTVAASGAAHGEFVYGALGPAATALGPRRPVRGGTPVTLAELGQLLGRLLAAAGGRPGAGVDTAVLRTIVTPTGPVQGDVFGALQSGGLGFRLADREGVRRISFASAAAGQTLVIGYPASGNGVVVVAADDRTGMGFAREVAQRVAVLESWRDIPGKD